VDLLYTQSNLQEILEVENFDNCCLDFYSCNHIDPLTGRSSRESILTALRICHEFVDTFSNDSRSILLYGDTGVGKTFLINCITKELLDSSHSCIYLTAPQLIRILERSAFRRDEDADDYEQDSADYIWDCDLLIIDDLGSELNNSFVNAQLFTCIDKRLTAGRSTLISTNLQPEQLQSVYSERISSRLLSSYQVLWIFGDDIRMRLSLAT
jgi:DNA replication protein DnaC